MSRVGIIGGTGFALPDAEILTTDTPYGEVDVARAGGIFFVSRHGREHVPPHRIVHRANIDALARCKVDAIFAINTVGALDPAIPVGALVVPDDLIDLRKSTETFHETRAVHVDVTRPYCPTLRDLLLAEGAREGGTYAATEGPRLETAAEVRMLRALGGHVVGMTGCPEATLARERGICYASLCLVLNAAAGVHPAPLVARDLHQGAAELMPRALDSVLRAARGVARTRPCRCRDALAGAALS